MIRTDNDFMMALAHDETGPILMPMLRMVVRDKQQAYRTAAWLIHMADASLPDDGTEATLDDVAAAIAST